MRPPFSADGIHSPSLIELSCSGNRPDTYVANANLQQRVLDPIDFCRFEVTQLPKVLQNFLLGNRIVKSDIEKVAALLHEFSHSSPNFHAEFFIKLTRQRVIRP